MRKSLFITLEEQLEIEILEESRRKANKIGDGETLFDNLAQQQKVEEETSKEDPDASDSAEPEAQADAAEEPAQDEAAGMESLSDFTFALEEYSEHHWDNKPSMAKRLLSAAQELGVLGIKYTPIMLKTVFKGVLYAFGVLGELFMKSTSATLKYLERRNNSFDKLSKSIDSLSKSLDIVKDTASFDGQQFTEQAVINSLKSGDNVDFITNIKALNAFTKDAIGGIEKQVALDIGRIKHIISISNFTHGVTVADILPVKPFSSKLKPGSVKGYGGDEERTVSYIYSEGLPSDIALMAFLPKNTQTVDEASNCYGASKLILGFNSENFKAINAVDFMSIQDLRSLLKELKALCDVCIAQKVFYEQLLTSKKQIKFGLQTYFTRISSANRKISVKESLVEYVYLKTLFIDKVYLAGGIDIHDYNAKTISMALKYVEAHVKKLA